MTSSGDEKREPVSSLAKEAPPKLKWRTPVLTEDFITEVTRNRFAAGIDAYEMYNPVGYGVS